MPRPSALIVLAELIRRLTHRRTIARGAALCLGATLLLAGCASSLKHSREQFAATQRSTEREAALQSTWNGQPYGILVATYGAPLYTMNIPGDRPNETVAVYGIRDNASRCIDAFTVFHGSEQTRVQNNSTVTSYFCR